MSQQPLTFTSCKDALDSLQVFYIKNKEFMLDLYHNEKTQIERKYVKKLHKDVLKSDIINKTSVLVQMQDHDEWESFVPTKCCTGAHDFSLHVLNSFSGQGLQIFVYKTKIDVKNKVDQERSELRSSIAAESFQAGNDVNQNLMHGIQQVDILRQQGRSRMPKNEKMPSTKRGSKFQKKQIMTKVHLGNPMTDDQLSSGIRAMFGCSPSVTSSCKMTDIEFDNGSVLIQVLVTIKTIDYGITDPAAIHYLAMLQPGSIDQLTQTKTVVKRKLKYTTKLTCDPTMPLDQVPQLSPSQIQVNVEELDHDDEVNVEACHQIRQQLTQYLSAKQRISKFTKKPVHVVVLPKPVRFYDYQQNQYFTCGVCFCDQMVECGQSYQCGHMVCKNCFQKLWAVNRRVCCICRQHKPVRILRSITEPVPGGLGLAKSDFQAQVSIQPLSQTQNQAGLSNGYGNPPSDQASQNQLTQVSQVPQPQVPQNQVSQNQVPQNQVPQNQASQNQVSQNQVPQSQVFQTQSQQPQPPRQQSPAQQPQQTGQEALAGRVDMKKDASTAKPDLLAQIQKKTAENLRKAMLLQQQQAKMEQDIKDIYDDEIMCTEESQDGNGAPGQQPEERDITLDLDSESGLSPIKSPSEVQSQRNQLLDQTAQVVPDPELTNSPVKQKYRADQEETKDKPADNSPKSSTRSLRLQLNQMGIDIVSDENMDAGQLNELSKLVAEHERSTSRSKRQSVDIPWSTNPSLRQPSITDAFLKKASSMSSGASRQHIKDKIEIKTSDDPAEELDDEELMMLPELEQFNEPSVVYNQESSTTSRPPTSGDHNSPNSTRISSEHALGTPRVPTKSTDKPNLSSFGKHKQPDSL